MTTTTESVAAEQVQAEQVQAEQVQAGEGEKTVAGGLVERVKSGLGEAQKGLHQLEAEAQQALATLGARADASRQALKGLLTRLEGMELKPEVARDVVVKKVAEVQEVATKRLAEVQAAARQQLQGLPGRLVEGAGVASQQQVRALQQEVAQLSRKLDAVLSAKKGPKSEGRAA